MKILVVGGGGREHALVWQLTQSRKVGKIWCAPGNGGIASEAECIAVDPGDVAALAALAEKLQPDLTVVGPELPLVHGIGDVFRARKWPIVAPGLQASQLEGSKSSPKSFWSGTICQPHGATARIAAQSRPMQLSKMSPGRW